jgi:hypothetical protein
MMYASTKEFSAHPRLTTGIVENVSIFGIVIVMNFIEMAIPLRGRLLAV